MYKSELSAIVIKNYSASSGVTKEVLLQGGTPPRRYSSKEVLLQGGTSPRRYSSYPTINLIFSSILRQITLE